MDEFNLRMNNDPEQSTTRYNTTIDAVFSRHLEKFKLQFANFCVLLQLSQADHYKD